MHTYPLAEYMRYIESGHWGEVGRLLLASAQKLVDGGAELLLCPDNTVHQALDLVRAQSPHPWLHIAEEVGAAAKARGFRRLGILGTRYLMEGPVYPAALAAQGIACEIPDPGDRGRINAVIFDELVRSEFKSESRRYYQSVIGRLANRGCDAVVLGCTEIPLLISEADSQLPIIDSTRALARAALREATVSVSPIDRERPAVLLQEGVHAVAPDEGGRLLEVWEASVRATHDFLSESDIEFFKPLVLQELFALEHLRCVRDSEGRLIGFVGVAGTKMEALFVHPSWHRAGVGRRLARHAVVELGATMVDVNEQNRQAVAFYRRLGFEVEGRSETDGLGKPFPLLHLRKYNLTEWREA